MAGKTGRSSRAGAADTEALARLTPREHEVLGHVAEGMTSAAIAERLDISLATVKRHLRNTYRKLGARNRVQASNVFHRGSRPDAT